MKWETHKPETSIEARQFLREFHGKCEFLKWGYRYWAKFTVGERDYDKIHDYPDEFGVVDAAIPDLVSARALWEQWQEERRKLQKSRAPKSKGPEPFSAGRPIRSSGK